MNKYISFAISIAVISWVVGMAINTIVRKTEFYSRNLSSLNFIKSNRLNRTIGIDVFRWIVKNTFFKYLNQKIKFDKRVDKSALEIVRNEMTISEIDHLIAFIFVSVVALIKSININYLFGLTIMIVNVLMNLYPSLLQQENKRRIDKLIKKL